MSEGRDSAEFAVPTDLACVIDALVAGMPNPVAAIEPLVPLVRPSLNCLPGQELTGLRFIHHIFMKKHEWHEWHGNWAGICSQLHEPMKGVVERVLELYSRTFHRESPSVEEWKAVHKLATDTAELYQSKASSLRSLWKHWPDKWTSYSEHNPWWIEVSRAPVTIRLWQMLFASSLLVGILLAMNSHWILSAIAFAASWITWSKQKIASRTRNIVSRRVQVESELVVSAALAGLRFAEREAVASKAGCPRVLGGSECAKTVALAVEFEVASRLEESEYVERSTRRWLEKSRVLFTDEEEQGLRTSWYLNFGMDLYRSSAVALEDRSGVANKDT